MSKYIKSCRIICVIFLYCSILQPIDGLHLKEILSLNVLPRPPNVPLTTNSSIFTQNYKEQPVIEEKTQIVTDLGTSIHQSKLSKAAKKSDGWWNHVYANAPDDVKRIIVPKSRYVESHETINPPVENPSIRIIFPEGRFANIQGSLKDTPAVLLKRLEESAGYSAATHNLFFNGNVLDLDKSLESQHVPADIPLHLKPGPIAYIILPTGQRLIITNKKSKDSVSMIKELIEIETGIPKYQQILKYGTIVLNNDQSLIKQGVPYGADIILEKLQSFSIRTPQKDIITIDIDQNLPISRLKSVIETKTGISSDIQELRYKEQLLMDNKALIDLNIPMGSIIDLNILPGVIAVLPNNKHVPIQAALTDKVEKIKEEIFRLEPLKSGHITCYYQNRLLSDTLSLEDQQVPYGSHISCIEKLMIIIHLLDNSTLSLLMKDDSTIFDIKNEIEKHAPLASNENLLFYNEKQVDDTLTLKELNIPSDSHFYLKPKSVVNVEIQNGDILSIPGKHDTITVQDIKKIIQEKLNVPYRDITINYQGNILKDDHLTLNELSIPIGSSLSMTYSNFSGPFLPQSEALKVLLPDKSIVELEGVSIDDTADTVRNAIFEQTRLPAISLFYDSKPIRDNTKSLRAQGIPSNALLDTGTTTYALKYLSSAALANKLPDCDVILDGVDCFTDPLIQDHYRHYEQRLLWVMIGYCAILFILAIIIQTILKLLTLHVSKSRDRFIREFMETAFRSITIVALVIAVVEIFLNFDIFEFRLEHKIFRKFEQVAPAFGASDNVLKDTFFRMSQIVQFFLASYLILVLYLAMMFWIISHWLRKIDREPMQHIIEHKNNIRRQQLNYIALRYEFSDSVEVMTVRGLDPEFYNFVEYLRACLLKIMTSLIRFPITIMFIGIIAMFLILPVGHFRRFRMICLMLSLLMCSILILFGIYLRASSVTNQLLPKKILDYISLRYRYNVHEAPITDDELQEVGPVYKYSVISRKTICCQWWVKFFYRTRYPNKHEMLFWLWRNGPCLLYRLFQGALFMGLCVIAHTFFLINEQWNSWVVYYGPWPLITFLCLIGLILFLIPHILWIVLIATSTSGVIKEHILSEVWELQRSETVRRIAQFIDALRIEATLYEISNAGESFMQQLAEKAQAVSPEVAAENYALWEDLDDDNDGEINLPQLYSFLIRQGLNITSEEETLKWFSVFDLDKSGGIDKAEFAIIISIAKQLTRETLDVETVQKLLINRYDFDPKSDQAVTADNLNRLVKELHIHHSWNHNQLIHLLAFISGQRGTPELSVDKFINGLKRVETETIGTLTQAVDDLKSRTALHDETNEFQTILQVSS